MSRLAPMRPRPSSPKLIARAEKGESFVITKNGRPVARITPMIAFNRDKAREAAERIRELARKQGARPSERWLSATTKK